jgi:hypothetical protein
VSKARGLKQADREKDFFFIRNLLMIVNRLLGLAYKRLKPITAVLGEGVESAEAWV